MKYRKGVFLVVYSGKKPEYLLLERILHWTGWEFPKGGVEGNEDSIKTVSRELKEETGLKAQKILDLKVSGKFDYPVELPDRPGIKGQTFKLFAVEVSSKKVEIDKREHSSYRWANYKEAEKLLTWNVQKRCLKIADKFVKNTN